MCDIDEMMVIEIEILEEGYGYDTGILWFPWITIHHWMYGSDLVHPLHKNTLENDGSPKGLCSSEGDFWDWRVRMERGRELKNSYEMVDGIMRVCQRGTLIFVVVSHKIVWQPYG